MSAYYWADPPTSPVRIYFVGVLFVVGTFLYLYKGFSDRENYTLNAAAVCAFGVALVPMDWNCASCPKITLHGAFAVILFLCMGYVAISCARETLPLLTAGTSRHKYEMRYRMCAFLMMTAPLSASLMAGLSLSTKRYVFFIEAVGIWAFAFYWWTKSNELAESCAELDALKGLPVVTMSLPHAGGGDTNAA